MGPTSLLAVPGRDPTISNAGGMGSSSASGTHAALFLSPELYTCARQAASAYSAACPGVVYYIATWYYALTSYRTMSPVGDARLSRYAGFLVAS